MTERKRVYISGKITGNPYAKIQFEEAYRILERHGFSPLSPFHFGQTMFADTKEEEHLRVGLLLLTMADYICVLPNFMESENAKAEYDFAIRKGKGIIDAEKAYKVIVRPGWREFAEGKKE